MWSYRRRRPVAANRPGAPATARRHASWLKRPLPNSSPTSGWSFRPAPVPTSCETSTLQLFADDADWGPRATALAARTFELTEFLARFAPETPLPNAVGGQVTYHDSCKGLRGLGIKQQPRALLFRVKGLQLTEMADCEECCGFGGAFSVNFGDVSTRIVDRKCESIAAVGADAVVGGDLGCLLNIEGRLRRRGDERTRVLHIAEVLAGGGES